MLKRPCGLLVYAPHQIDIQDYSLVQAIRSCVVDGSHLLALGNEQGLQVRGLPTLTSSAT